jgi:predicted HAD superfamily Cof-like phosphohydrolase
MNDVVRSHRISEEYGLMVGDDPHRNILLVWEHHDPVYDIDMFHRKFGQAYNGPPRELPLDLFNFREGFLREELDEFRLAYHKGDKENQVDSLIDLIYVAYGTLHLMGIDSREAWRRVHRANMGKVLANPEGDERSHRDVKYDIVKPEGWLPPSHADLV